MPKTASSEEHFATSSVPKSHDLLGYRLYRDLKRGWRITSPNLEQAGLLSIDYASLNELARS